MNSNDSVAELLNRDFCPWANRYVYWLKKPFGVLIVATVVSLLCGVFVAPQGLVIATALASTIAIGMIWPWLGLRGISCELRFPHRRSVEGQVTSVEVILRNRWPFPVWGLAIENGFFLRESSEDSTAVALSGIQGWSRTTFRWDFRPECRGVYPSTVPTIVTEFPFGLWKARKEIEAVGSLIVWPRTISLSVTPLAAGANQTLVIASDERAGTEGDRIGVRAFREGDSLRFVHWAQTAKCGRLIVSERQGPAQASAVVALDADPAIGFGYGPTSSIESSIRIAASLCEQLTGQNVTVTMLVNGERWTISPSDLSRRRCFDQLAMLKPKTGHSIPTAGDLGEERFLITTSRRNTSGTTWKEIVVTDGEKHMSPSAVEAWIVVDGHDRVLPQFRQQWERRTRLTPRGKRSRLGVAS